MADPKSSPRKNQRGRNLLLIAACLAAGYTGGSLSQPDQISTTNTDVQRQIVSSEAEVFSSIAKEVGESVVSVDVTTQQIQQDFFGFQRSVEGQAAGTGVIISDKGIVVTNKHVVPSGTTEVSVTLFDGTVLDAEVIARDTRNDIAFLKIKDAKGKTLKAARLADSSQVQVGEKVIAIGNALGEFQNTVTSGIVSGYGREIVAGDFGDSEQLSNLIQTDAAINQGNSGGPLVNLSGEVIGINTAITSSSSGQSLGFSIPVNDIKNLIDSVIEKGKIERPYLGVRYRMIDERYAFVYNLERTEGAYLPPSEDGQATVLSGSPADKAGLQEKDIIIKIDDRDVNSQNDLVTVLSAYQVGDVVKVTYIRDGQEKSVDLKLEAAPQE